MISKGLVLMVLGMAIVFILLTVLILFMDIVRVIVNGGKKKQLAHVTGEAGGAETGAHEIAAIVAAVTTHNIKKG